ncbi:MAG: phosphatidylglycerophosphatase A [Acidobacteria bacterium]|nr:phosphatidylglycerophosphatase A [Acidobacteriota bacterium]
MPEIPSAAVEESHASARRARSRIAVGGVAHLIASGFYAGHFPFAPGTAGSAVAIPILLLLRMGGTAVYGAGLIVITALAVYTAGVTERQVGRHDPSCVVADEIAGMLLTMLFVPFTVTSLAVGFLLFRIADIIKPFPGRRCERLPGGWGIVTDDLVAALYANAVLQLIFRVLT